MTKKERELRAQLAQVTNEARQLAEENKLEEAKAKAAEAKSLKEQIELLQNLDDLETGNGKLITDDPANKDEAEQEKEYKAAFMKAFRMQRLSADERNLLEARNAMTEGSAADGGLAVPQDIQTAINEYKRSLPDLTRYINVIPVNTNTGTRVFEQIATMTPFENITNEGADDIPDMGNPKLVSISYTIKKYAGWLPVSNDLLKDTDQAIMDFLRRWIGKKSVVTRNTLILNLLGTLDKVSFADWKAMKKALNVTLDPMLAAGAIVLTNQDGFQLMDTWTDGQNRPLIKPDVTQPSSNLIFGKPIVIVPNSVMPSTGTTTKLAPCIIGNLAELVTMFERQGYQIDTTNVGGTAFRKDNTEVRCIEREDVKLIDSGAAVYGELDVTAI